MEHRSPEHRSIDDLDCTKAMFALYEFLDGELTGERRQIIEGHLDGCPHCFSVFDFEAELRIVVRARVQRTGRPPSSWPASPGRSSTRRGASGPAGLGMPGTGGPWDQPRGPGGLPS